MKITLVLAAPKPESFNHAIANQAVAALESQGHEARLHDLYAEGFDPVYTAAELARDVQLPAALAAHIDEVCATDGLIFVHPNYWSRPPAMLCGWVDRVLRPGRAYQFVPDGSGGARPQGLLKARVGMVFNTANTPQEIEAANWGDPLEVHWRKVVFGLCGVPTVFRRNFAPVITSTAPQRQAWLAEVQAEVLRHFPAAPRPAAET